MMKQLVMVAVAIAALGAVAVVLPANTCIVSGETGRTPPTFALAAMDSGLDSSWRMFARCTIDRFWPVKPRGSILLVK